MTPIEEKLKMKIAAVEPFSREELEAAKKVLPRDADVLTEIHKRIMGEFNFMVELSIVEGLAGHVEQAVLAHKLSYQCMQINGMLMERARGEGPMEHWIDARERK
jgi:hypothetical protein